LSLRGWEVASAGPKPIVAKRWGDAGGQPRQCGFDFGR
jgi:hypothetical protein